MNIQNLTSDKKVKLDPLLANVTKSYETEMDWNKLIQSIQVSSLESFTNFHSISVKNDPGLRDSDSRWEGNRAQNQDAAHRIQGAFYFLKKEKRNSFRLKLARATRK